MLIIPHKHGKLPKCYLWENHNHTSLSYSVLYYKNDRAIYSEKYWKFCSIPGAGIGVGVHRFSFCIPWHPCKTACVGMRNVQCNKKHRCFLSNFYPVPRIQSSPYFLKCVHIPRTGFHKTPIQPAFLLPVFHHTQPFAFRPIFLGKFYSPVLSSSSQELPCIRNAGWRWVGML